MALDPVKNFAISRVATAPSPADSGTTLVVETGDGSLFPDPSSSGEYNVVIYPNGEQPTSSNAEIVRVTARTSDTMTITRQQESTTARAIAEGDIVMLAITAKMVSDLSTAITGVVTETGTQTLTNKTIDAGDNTLSGLLDLFYPVGTIYETTSTDLDTTTKMGNHFGGTWEAYGSGRVLVAKSADTEFDTIGETGGAKTHTHTLSSSAYAKLFPSTDGYTSMKRISSDSYNTTHRISGTVATDTQSINLGTELGGTTESGSSLQPYIVVFRYRRTA